MRTGSWTAYLCTAEEYNDFSIERSYSFNSCLQDLSEYRKQLTHSGKAGYLLPTEPLEYLNKCLELSYKE